ncbi:MAG: recombination protein RecR, partial [Desulfovibrionaceae bacterium]|nr:recombination protein RecR [Desulfovibrionaceae bacterium]
ERRLSEGLISELILALGTRLEAESTAAYLKDRLNRAFPQLVITRLAQGIPLGADLRFMDKETLRLSLHHRQRA